MVRTGLLAASLLLLYPLTAIAQPDGTGAGGEVELDEDPAPAGDGESGAEEDPNAPRLGDEPVEEGPKAPAARRTGYPTREVERPLTLPDFTSEVRLDIRLFPDPIDAELGLRARYGITRQIQVGVRYGIGGFYNDGKQDKTRFNTGKAVAIEAQYLVFDWLAPRVSIPMYVDPFAIGVTIGPAMKFRIGDRLALVGLEDLLAFKLTDKFVPDLENERVNEAQADNLVVNGINPDGYIRIEGGVIYQMDDKLAVGGRFGVQFIDFQDSDAATGLRVNAQYTPKPNVDLLGSMGFNALDDAETFHITAAVAFRI